MIDSSKVQQLNILNDWLLDALCTSLFVSRNRLLMRKSLATMTTLIFGTTLATIQVRFPMFNNLTTCNAFKLVIRFPEFSARIRTRLT